jgi:DNA-binding IclR family transcriptional regulator
MWKQISEEETPASSQRSVFRTADILKCLNNNINTLSDIMENCNLSDSTAHRLLDKIKLKPWIQRSIIKWQVGKVVS